MHGITPPPKSFHSSLQRTTCWHHSQSKRVVLVLLLAPDSIAGGVADTLAHARGRVTDPYTQLANTFLSLSLALSPSSPNSLSHNKIHGLANLWWLRKRCHPHLAQGPRQSFRQYRQALRRFCQPYQSRLGEESAFPSAKRRAESSRGKEGRRTYRQRLLLRSQGCRLVSHVSCQRGTVPGCFFVQALRREPIVLVPWREHARTDGAGGEEKL